MSILRFDSSGGCGAVRVPFGMDCCCGSCNWTSKFEGETTSISCIPEVDKIEVRCLMTVRASSCVL